MINRIINMMRLLEFTDSALPVGTFSFSNALESATEEGLVCDADTLRSYTLDVAMQASYSDAVAALHAHRAYLNDNYDAFVAADHSVVLCKMNAEARLMTTRMGKKLAELVMHISPDAMLERWIVDIDSKIVPGTYPAAQGAVFARNQLSEQELFCSHIYGVMNMVLSAALRCVRVSHYDTQKILFDLAERMPAMYDRIRDLSLDDMASFVPQIDILASLHEKGVKRMFMN